MNDNAKGVKKLFKDIFEEITDFQPETHEEMGLIIKRSQKLPGKLMKYFGSFLDPDKDVPDWYKPKIKEAMDTQRTCLTLEEVAQRVGLERFIGMVLIEVADPGFTNEHLRHITPTPWPELDPITFPDAGFKALVDRLRTYYGITLKERDDAPAHVTLYNQMVDTCLEKGVRSDSIGDTIKLFFALMEEDNIRDMSCKDLAWSIVHGDLPDFTEVQPLFLIQEFIGNWDHEVMGCNPEEYVIKEFRAMFNG
jgi:hypothetical protein